MEKKTLFLIGCLALLALQTNAQERKAIPEKWNIKSNLLYDATGTVNLGVELALAQRWSLDLSGNYNGWDWKDNRKWKHWMLQPEARLWTRQSLKGHFFALHALGGEYNMGKVHLPFGLFKELRTMRHEGWYLGGGIGYGHRWNLSSRWGIEAEAAVGYIHFDYNKYECVACGEKLGTGVRNYLGPTKLAVSLVYRFGKQSQRVVPVVTPPIMLPDTVEIVKRDTIIIREETPVEPVVINNPEELHLRYRLGNADILPTFGSNAAELTRAMMMIHEVKNAPGVEIKRIVVTGYASPDGEEANNIRLASARTIALRDYFARELSAMRTKIIAIPGGEDWEGLDKAVRSDLLTPARIRILDIIAGAKAGNVAEAKAQLKEVAGGEAYRYLQDAIFPQLRRVECCVEYTHK